MWSLVKEHIGGLGAVGLHLGQGVMHVPDGGLQVQVTDDFRLSVLPCARVGSLQPEYPATSFCRYSRQP